MSGFSHCSRSTKCTDQACEVSDMSHTIAVTFPYRVIHTEYIPAHDSPYTYLVCNSSYTVAK